VRQPTVNQKIGSGKTGQAHTLFLWMNERISQTLIFFSSPFHLCRLMRMTFFVWTRISHF